jgi:chorismate mutase
MAESGSGGAWEQIELLRQRIDEIDRQLVELLNERASCVVDIGHVKRARNLALYQPDRERKVFEAVEAMNPGPLSGRALRRLFERILDESRSVERHAMEPAPGEARGPAEGGER